MPAPLIIHTPEESAGRQRRILPAIVGIMLATILLMGNGLPSRTLILSGTIGTVVGCGAMVLVQRLGASANSAIAAAATPLGYVPLYGPLLAGLARWPTGGFPTLDAQRWSLSRAFDHPIGDFRIFQGFIADGESSSHLFGAAIHVSDGRLPVFLVGPARTGLFSTSKPSLPVFLVEPAFALEHEIVTDDPRRLEQRLGRSFVSAWRDMSGWRIEGNGDWVLVSCDRAIPPDELPVITHALCSVADAIRQATRAT